MHFATKLSQFTLGTSYTPRDIQQIACDEGLLGTAAGVTQAKYKIVALNTKFLIPLKPNDTRQSAAFWISFPDSVDNINKGQNMQRSIQLTLRSVRVTIVAVQKR
jgi:hypothetical protein